MITLMYLLSALTLGGSENTILAVSATFNLKIDNTDNDAIVIC